MRAKEFLLEQDKNINITVPITITIPAGGDTKVSTAPQDDEKPEQPVMVPPLQQHIELAKQEAGKDSVVIDQLTTDDDEREDLVSDADAQEVGAASPDQVQKNIQLRGKFEELQAKLNQAISELDSPPVRST